MRPVSWCSGCTARFKQAQVIPEIFWYLSVVGGVILLTYAIHKRDPVFILGQSGGLLVYLRNLQWRLRERRQARKSRA